MKLKKIDIDSYLLEYPVGSKGRVGGVYTRRDLMKMTRHDRATTKQVREFLIKEFVDGSLNHKSRVACGIKP